MAHCQPADNNCEATRDMSQPRTIALDAMGGDQGPAVVVAGAAISLERHPALSFLFFGDEARIAAELEKLPRSRRSRTSSTPTRPSG